MTRTNSDRALPGLPQLEISVGGTPLVERDRPALLELVVRAQLSAPTQCELAFDLAAISAELAGVEAGDPLRVRAAGEPLFEGAVTAAELEYAASGAQVLRVRGYDVLHSLRKRQTVRAHVEVTVAELARELCGDLGVSVDAGSTGPLFHHVIQHRQSDLELLTELSARSGLFFWLRGSTLQLMTLEGGGAPISLELGRGLLEASFELNTDRSCQDVTASGWSPGEVTPYLAQVSAPRVGRSTEDPGGSAASPGRTLVSEGVEDAAQLEAVAQAELDRRVAAELIFRGVSDGDPRLIPGARVEIAGVAPRARGTYVLCSVTHRVNPEAGFVSELSTEPPAPPPKPTGASVALGRVTRVDGTTGRVRASLLAHREVETDWMQVAAPGAGAGKGLTMIPDVGDSVLVVFTQEDPARGVVLGGLPGKNAPHDTGVKGGAVLRFNLRSAGGQQLRLDDDRRVLRIENAGGSFIELAPGGITVHSGGQLTLEGGQVTIRGSAVDFEEAG